MSTPADDDHPAAGEQRDVEALAAGAATALVGRFAGRGLGFATGVVIARGLGPAVFGVYALALTFLRIGKLLTTLGLDKGLVSFGTPFWRRDGVALGILVRRALAFALGTGAALAVALWFAAPSIEGSFQKPGLATALRLVAAVLPFAGLLAVAAAGTRVTRTMAYSVVAEDMTQTSIHLALAAGLIYLGHGLLGAMTALVFSYAVAAMVALLFLVRLIPNVAKPSEAKPSEAKPSEAKPSEARPSGSAADEGSASSGSDEGSALPDTGRMLRFSLLASVGLTFSLLAMWLDKLVIGYFRGSDEVGVYQSASSIASLFPMVLNAFTAILWPLFAKRADQGDFDRIVRLYRIAIRWGLSIAIPAFLVVCLDSERVIRVVFDERFVAGSVPLIVLAISQLTNAATGPVGPLLLITGHKLSWFVISGCALVANIGLNIAMVPVWGMTGAAVATAISTALLFGGGLVVAYWRIGLVPYDRHVVRLLVAAIASAAAFELTVISLPRIWPRGADGLPGLLLSAFACGAVFLAVAAAFPHADEERKLLESLRVRLPFGSGRHRS